MIPLVVATLAVAAALVQIGPLSLLAADPVAAPLLPVAVVAGWGVARRADETWLALLLVPAVFGAASTDRVGLFVIALWPTAVLALFIRRLDDDPAGRRARRFAGAAAAAAAGGLCYVLLLGASDGHLPSIAAQPEALLTAVTLTGIAGALTAVALWPWRPRPRGLFE